jgi:hypothetical protein
MYGTTVKIGEKDVEIRPIFLTDSFNIMSSVDELLDSRPVFDFLLDRGSSGEASTEGAGQLAALVEVLSEGEKELIEKSSAETPEGKLLKLAYTCEALKLPILVHCKSSIDRTTIAVCMMSALRRFLSKGYLPRTNKGGVDFEAIIKNEYFKKFFFTNFAKQFPLTYSNV